MFWEKSPPVAKLGTCGQIVLQITPAAVELFIGCCMLSGKVSMIHTALCKSCIVLMHTAHAPWATERKPDSQVMETHVGAEVLAHRTQKVRTVECMVYISYNMMQFL